MEIKNILSLFDGMSCGQIALERAGIKFDNYFASEIDKCAIAVTMHNYPNTKQLGSVTEVDGYKLPKIDLLIGGSPCQSFSFAGKRKGMSTKCETEILTLEHYLELKADGYEFEGQSYLFWEYMRVLTEVKPKYFLLENVMMGEKWEKVLSKAIGVKAIEINSSLVSAQSRKRLYWTNIPFIGLPEDKNINLVDILETDSETSPAAIRGRRLNKATIIGHRVDENGHRQDYDKEIPISQCLEVRATNTNKSNCLTTVAKDNVLTTMPIGRHLDAFKNKLPFRYYTIKEYCRLQTVSDNYFDGVASDNQIRKMIGNGWTVDVIAWFFSFLK